MYIDAIQWYLSNTPYDIVFCENSGTDLSEYFPDEQRLDILTFIAENNPNEDQSKSSKELSIIKYAYDHSSKIVPGKLFVKITGRLKYLNIVDTINRMKIPANLAETEFICCDLGKTNLWSDSRFFFFTYPFFKRMFAKQSQINIRYEFERMLGSCVYQMLQNNDGAFYYIPMPQRISGIGGGVGISYDITDAQYNKALRKHRVIKRLFDLGILPRFRRSHIEMYGNK